jgi:hypothetical protein
VSAPDVRVGTFLAPTAPAIEWRALRRGRVLHGTSKKVRRTPCPMKRLSASSHALPSALEGCLGESLLGSGAGQASGVLRRL